MSFIYNNAVAGASGAQTTYKISRSLRFNSADSAFLSRTPASAGNRKTWTWSGWVKRSGLNSLQCLFSSGTTANASDVVILQFSDAAGSAADTLNLFSYPVSVTTTQVFRDTSAWYHIVWAFDTTQATASNRSRLYVNGVEVTNLSGTYPAQNTDYGVNASGVLHNIGRYTYDGSRYLNGYLADVHFIDGQALTPSSFAETNATTGQWVPKTYTGSYGTNGFRLDFSDNSAATATTLGKDRAGSNNWTPNNFSVTAGADNDSLVDTPTSYGTGNSGGDVRGNYATLNVLTKVGDGTVRNGNLELEGPSNSADTVANATIGVSSGKWYWEVTALNSSGTINGGQPRGVMGVKGVASLAGHYPGASADGYGYATNGQKVNSGSFVNYGAAINTNDIIGVALDLDNGTITFYENNVSQGTAYSSLPAGTYFPSVSGAGNGVGSSAMQWACNFGQRPFAYTAPSGFKALCDTNLPALVVAKPNTVMDIQLWTGNGSAGRAITGYGFSPDLVWIKSRSAGYSHALFDTVRGVQLGLQSNATNAEISDSDALTAFNSNGFTVGTGNTIFGVNTSSQTFVGWAWDAGSSTVTNTAGSITSQVRANASAGFSIVAWTGNGSSGATIGHGLNVVPSLIIGKQRSAVNDWVVFHTAVGNTSALFLNSTSTPTASALYWNNTSPSSTVFTVGSGTGLNQNTSTYVAYCFAPVAGYSSFGSYTGNGSTDGPFVYTGFRPRWILVKSSSNAAGWVIYDAVRLGYNQNNPQLYANSSDAEYASTGFFEADILSNGFKLRNVGSATNSSGAVYIYAAFAESPFQYARAR